MSYHLNEPQNQDLLFLIEALENQLEAAKNMIEELQMVIQNQQDDIFELEGDVDYWRHKYDSEVY